MKRILLILCAVLALQTAQAQIKIGVKGGLNLTNMKIEKDVFDAKNRVGFYVGPTLLIDLPISNLSLDVSALYDQHNNEIEGLKIQQKSVLVPANLRLNFGLSERFGIYVAAGPQLSFNIGDSEFKWDDLSTLGPTFKVRESQFSVNLGGGVKIGNLEAQLAYNIPCGRTGDIGYATVRDDVKAGVKANTHAWQLGLAYFF